MELFSLPDEVLAIIFASLLPPFPSQSFIETYTFTVPYDLLSARLVCRRSHCIATPFAWRRVRLRIASPSPKLSGNRSALRTESKHFQDSLARCGFFHENPHLAIHVRVLLVSIEWDEEIERHGEHPGHAREALRIATRSMSDLRAVLVWDYDVLLFQDFWILFQHPLLRVIRLMDVDGSAFPARGSWAAGLKMLHIANSYCPARIFAGATADLECLSIEPARSCPITQPVPTLRDIPWKTLREVSLVGCVNETDWLLFLNGFQRHMQLALPAALTELVIGDLGGLHPTRTSQLLRTFRGHPLRRLALYYVLSLDPLVLEEIVSVFPALSTLTLLTEGGLVTWPAPLDTYAQKLAYLPRLVTLAWNNFALNSTMEYLTPKLRDSALYAGYIDHSRTLLRHVGTLRYIRLTSMMDGIVDTIRMGPRRDGDVYVSRSTHSVAIHTSSWDTSSDAFEDL